MVQFLDTKGNMTNQAKKHASSIVYFRCTDCNDLFRDKYDLEICSLDEGSLDERFTRLLSLSRYVSTFKLLRFESVDDKQISSSTDADDSGLSVNEFVDSTLIVGCTAFGICDKLMTDAKDSRFDFDRQKFL